MSEDKALRKIHDALAQIKKHHKPNENSTNHTTPVMDIRIFSTGGTMDKIHDPISEKLIFGKNSHIQNMLDEAFVNHVACEKLFMIDSLDMTDNHRQQILEAINNAQEKQIIITHGTSTMAETADYLNKQLGENNDKTIVLTGAFRPYSLLKSDAKFNLGCAITATQILLAGVYVTMNGRVFAAGDVRKNIEQCRFEYLGDL